MRVPWMTLLVATFLVSSSVRAMAVEVSGKWIAEVSGSMLLEPVYARVTLSKSGEMLDGAWGKSTLRGTVKSNTVVLTLTDDEGHEAGALTGQIAGDSGEGTGTMIGLGRRGGRGAGGRPPMP